MSLIHCRLTHLLAELGETEKVVQTKKTKTKRLWTEFAHTVRQARLRNGITLKQLAMKTGIGKGTLFYLEQNERQWTIERAKVIIKALK